VASAVRLRTAISGQRGQSSAEYIAALLLVAAIIAVVVASPVGPQVRVAVGELSCKLLSDDGACGGEVAGGDPAPAGGAAPAGEEAQEDEPGLLEQGFDALGDGAGALAGGLGDLASAGGDLLSGAGDLLSGGLEAAGDVLGGVLDGGGALLSGLVLGDFGGAYDNPWLESLRQIGQFASGVLVFGDIRDAASAIGEIIASGGKEGWGNLGLSLVGIVPVFGDAAKGIKGLDAIVSAFRAGDRARDGSRAADGARGANGARGIDEARGAEDAARGGRRYWDKSTTFNGNRVYQRDDLIGPARVDARGRSNVERMKRGLAPVGPDGESLELHHTIQTADGPIAEMTASFHRRYRREIHINPQSTPSGIDRPTFNRWRRQYWKSRAKDFGGG